MTTNALPAVPGGEVIVYESPEGEGSVDVRFKDESVWLTQRQMAEVFQSTPENILTHLRNVFSSKELDAEATTKGFLVVRSEGKRSVRRKIRHYNLDAIISVGYRVHSKRAALHDGQGPAQGDRSGASDSHAPPTWAPARGSGKVVERG